MNLDVEGEVSFDGTTMASVSWLPDSDNVPGDDDEMCELPLDDPAVRGYVCEPTPGKNTGILDSENKLRGSFSDVSDTTGEVQFRFGRPCLPPCSRVSEPLTASSASTTGDTQPREEKLTMGT